MFYIHKKKFRSAHVWVEEKKSMCQTEKYIAPRRGGVLYFGAEVALIVLLTIFEEYLISDMYPKIKKPVLKVL